jgi:hypothetical protein
MEWLGIRWVGINPENGQKLLLTLALLAIMLAIGYVARRLANRVFDADGQTRIRFWSRQAISVVVTVVTFLGLLSIWLDNPARLANSRIFDEPVYNYTREFPFIWEEMTLPVGFKSDRNQAERVLLDAAARHAVRPEEIGEGVRRRLRERYFIDLEDFTPRVFVRLTDNWVEMTVRFLVPDHGVRERKDSMARDVLAALERSGIGVASTTYEIVGMPPLRVEGAGVLDGAARNVSRMQR